MGYPDYIYERASMELGRRRRTAQLEAKAHLDEVYEALPQIRDMDNALRSSAISLSMLVLSGKANVSGTLDEMREHNLGLQSRRAFLLSNAGYPENYTEPQYSCPLCNDTGRVQGIFCSCYKEQCKREAQKVLDECSGAAPCDFSNFNLDYYPENSPALSISPKKKMAEIFEFCKSYAEKFPGDKKSILMTGKTGLGKTHLSLSIAKAVINKGHGVYYGSAHRVFDKLEKERFVRSQSEMGTLNSLTQCDLLIIDDLGAEFSTAFTVAAFGDIVNTRLIEQRPTLVSTNLTLGELTSKYTERTASRIFGEYSLLQFIGDDIRVKKNCELFP